MTSQGSKKYLSAHPGKLYIPLMQVTFSPHLLHGQEPRKADFLLTILKESQSKFLAHGYDLVFWQSLTNLVDCMTHIHSSEVTT